MLKIIFSLMLTACAAFSQPYYTPVRASIGAEILGTAPIGQVYAEAMFSNRKKSFWDVSAGLGAIWQKNFKTFTLSSSLGYVLLLNPYKRKSCKPRPCYHGFEAYIEGGIATYFADTYDSYKYISDIDNQRIITPLALMGLRFHVISSKWIYIVKVRYTPALLESHFASKAGLALGIGWR